MSNRPFLQKKPLESFQKDIQDTFRLLSYPNSKVEIMGTSRASFKYASDIDMFDVIYVHDDLKTFSKDISQFFKKMIRSINKDKDLYFVDFIATTDEDNQPKHWTRNEILKGDLSKIMTHKNVIKIDIAQYIDNRFVALSNWYEIRYPNGVGINAEKETRDTPQSLKQDMKKFYYEKQNYLKVLKRLFIIAQKDKNKKLLDKLIRIFESDLGKLYKLKSELDTMISVLENYNNKTTIERVKQSLQSIKQDSSATGFQFPPTYYNKFDKLQTYKSPRSLIPRLDALKKYLLEKVNKLTMKQIKSQRIGLSKYI